MLSKPAVNVAVFPARIRGVLRHLGDGQFFTQSIALALVGLAVDPFLEQEGVI
jgi:hypothetical protein